MKKSVTVRVQPNLALVKYWGKRDEGINIPATSSLGITLDGLFTTTTVTFRDSAFRGPQIRIGEALQDSSRFLPFFKTLEEVLVKKGLYSGKEIREIISRLYVESSNSFPTAAGLASSSSGLGALASGIDALIETGLPPRELSALARSGSGSAARTLYGGFVEFREGAEYALQLHPAEFWPEFRIILLTVSTDMKKTSSRSGMTATKLTSPYFPSWVEDSRKLFEECRQAVAARDIEKTGALARLSYMRMFATMIASDPPLLYWQPGSLEILHTLEDLRRSGTGVWETMDAGPQVKLICLENECSTVTEAFSDLPVKPVILKAGTGPEVIESCV